MEQCELFIASVHWSGLTRASKETQQIQHCSTHGTYLLLNDDARISLPDSPPLGSGDEEEEDKERRKQSQKRWQKEEGHGNTRN